MEIKKVSLVKNYFKCPECGNKIYVVSIDEKFIEMVCRDEKCNYLFVERRKA